jgi:hypothetical protein
MSPQQKLVTQENRVVDPGDYQDRFINHALLFRCILWAMTGLATGCVNLNSKPQSSPDRSKAAIIARQVELARHP